MQNVYSAVRTQSLSSTDMFCPYLKQFVITRSLPLQSVQQIKATPIFISELNTSNRLRVILGYRCGLNKTPRSYRMSHSADWYSRTFRGNLSVSSSRVTDPGCVTSQKSEDQTEQIYCAMKIDSETACPILRSQMCPLRKHGPNINVAAGKCSNNIIISTSILCICVYCCSCLVCIVVVVLCVLL